MMIDKPTLDRDRLLQEERRQQTFENCLDAMLRELGPEEALGRPFRRGGELIVPIHRRPLTPDVGSPSAN